jgi:hypothetical protein
MARRLARRDARSCRLVLHVINHHHQTANATSPFGAMKHGIGVHHKQNVSMIATERDTIYQIQTRRSNLHRNCATGKYNGHDKQTTTQTTIDSLDFENARIDIDWRATLLCCKNIESQNVNQSTKKKKKHKTTNANTYEPFIEIANVKHRTFSFRT